jgi:hypothetical protein
MAVTAGQRRRATVSDLPAEWQTRPLVLEALRALLSDDHNYERGLATLKDLVERVLREDGAGGLRDFAVALSLALATALERIAQDQRLAAEDLVDVWFAE